MGVVPKKPLERIQFYENHVAPFTANATAIGVTTSEISGLSTKTTAARAAYTAATTARQASETATNIYRDAVEAMTFAGAGLLKKIRGQAETTGNTNIYNLAQIPAPATPSARGIPGTPFRFTVELQPNGTLLLKWKCNNPVGASGTVYQVFRRATPEGAFEYVGGNGRKKFNDETVPAGVTRLTYQVQAVRSTAVGVFAEFNVNFGTNAGGGATATLVEATPVKIAA